MDDSSNRPRVFVSSTISDLHDLRSALKFWLEELGVRVFMSEFNDFERLPDQGTFESCLATIENCNYYVLLVGWKWGTEISPGVSVTQREYREAAKWAKEGAVKPIIFARREVIAAIRDYRRRVSEPSTDASWPEDLPPISKFVSEIENTEFGHWGEDPSGYMWIYRFHDFRDIADALRINLRLYGSVSRQSLLANLQWELTENIASMSSKHQNTPMTGYRWLDRLRTNTPLSLERTDQPVHLSEDDASKLVLFLSIGAPLDIRLRTSALRDCISSREFLKHNSATSTLDQSQELKVMYRLLKEIEGYASLYRFVQSRLSEILTPIEIARKTQQNPLISVIDLGFVFGMYDRLKNIMILSNSLLDFISDQLVPIRDVVLAASTPFGEETRTGGGRSGHAS